jgi:hypothetical protein
MDDKNLKPNIEVERDVHVDVKESVRVADGSADSKVHVSEQDMKQKPKDGEQRIDDVKGFVKKALGSKFATQNDGNVTTQYIFNIDSMNGDISSVEKEKPAAKSTNSAKTYKLYERVDCSEFVAEYKTSLHLAYAIAISLFEYVPVSDLQRLSERLLKRFPKTLDADGKEDKTHINPFLSLDAVLAVIGAETCKVSYTSRFENITERCVCFPEQHQKVMENLWELFPMLRSEITVWLIETDFISQLSNAFSTSCFVRAMANIVKLDFGDALSRLFPQLTSDPMNKYLMMRLFILLTDDEETKKNACEILKQWSTSSKWMWEIPFVVFAESDQDFAFKTELERTVRNKIIDGFDDEEEWAMKLIAGKMVTSKKLRTMVAEIFGKLFGEAKTTQDKTAVAIVYLLTVSTAYMFVDKEDSVLPLVAFDTKQQANNIQPVILRIITDFQLRQGLFDVLEAYLNEINDYEMTSALTNSLKSYFYVLAVHVPRYYGDIVRFLMRLQGKNNIAKDILQFLQEKINENKELMKV